jgi:DNA ligase (NAD+)
VITESDNDQCPDVCKYCGHKLEVVGTSLKCTNPECSGQGSMKVKRYIQILSHEMKGAGPSLIDDLIDINDIQVIDDLYTNHDEIVSTLNSLPNTVTNLELRELYNTVTGTKRTLNYFLVATSIIGLSWNGAGKLSTSKMIDFLEGRTNNVDRPKGVSTKSIQNIIDRSEELRSLYRLSGNQFYVEDANPSDDHRLKICITGSLSTADSRSDFFTDHKNKIIETNVKNCDYLVTNEVSNSSKYRYAVSNNVKIINEDDLLNIINQ